MRNWNSLVLKCSLLFILIFQQTKCKAQEKKYQSLLWKISGNNTESPSYLYGTMHVSERIAFHLSDVFFDAILTTDKVALESNPESWMDEMEKTPESYFFPKFSNKGFYQSFKRKPVEDYQLASLLKFNDYMTNGILYRTSESNEDYQEQTYLDMFIFQVGKRTNREIVPLEGFQESRNLVEKAAKGNVGFTPKPWTKKLLKDKSYYLVLQDAYRDKDLDLLDSLNRGFNSEAYIKFMLTQRNQNMVNRIDSILQKNQTLFSGVGAAHLPGDNGMIEMLRKKGYTVQPILGEYTKKGKETKENLDQKYIYEVYENQIVSDEILQVPSPKKLYEFGFYGASMYVSPDIKNGAFLSITRTNTYDFLKHYEYQSSPERMDSLFFENIPGKILEKEKININGFDAWNIKNETKSLDRQHYLVVVTPLEVIVVNLVGKNNFVADKEEEVFSNIKLKPITSTWETIEPLQGGYSVKLPSYYKISNNGEFSNLLGAPEIQAYDPTDKSYYFLIQNSINDIKYLEDTEFEHRRIHEQFFKSLKKDTLNTNYVNGGTPSFYSEGKINEKTNLKVKTLINGSHYYLLGTTSKKNADKFFNSFKFKPFNYYKEREEYVDSALFFKNKVALKPAKSYYDYQYTAPNYTDPDKNVFLEDSKIKNFVGESKKEIEVKWYKFHRYEYFENADSLWADLIKRNEDINSYKIKTKNSYSNKDNEFIFDAIYEDTASIQNVKARYILKNGLLYSLKTLVSDNYKNDDTFIEEFYTNFEPKDTIIGKSLFERKSKLFFNDLKSTEDSIKNSALKSIHKLEFKKEDIDLLIQTIKNYAFEDNQLDYKVDLIEALGDIKDKKVENFLTEYYTASEDNSLLQLAILYALANQENETTYKNIISLMENDLPLPYSYTSNLHSLFYQMKKDHEHSKVIFPDIFQFYTVPEYKDYVLNLTADLIDSSAIDQNQIIPFSKELITNAKLEIKRVKSQILSDKQKKYNYNVSPNLSNLFVYDKLLSYLPKNQNINDFYKKLDEIKEPSLDLYRIEKAIENKLKKPNKSIENLANDEEWQFILYETLYDEEQLDWQPQFLTDKKIALSKFKKASFFDEEKKDSLLEIKNDLISYKNKKYKYWVYKLWQKNEYEEESVDVHPKIAFISFELDKNNRMIPIKTQVEFNLTYIDEKELKNTFKNIEDRILFEDKKRVNFDDYNGGFYH